MLGPFLGQRVTKNKKNQHENNGHLIGVSKYICISYDWAVDHILIR